MTRLYPLLLAPLTLLAGLFPMTAAAAVMPTPGEIIQAVDIAEYDFHPVTPTLNRTFPLHVQFSPRREVAAEFDLAGFATVDSAILDLSTSAIVLSPFDLTIQGYVGNGVVEEADFFLVVVAPVFFGPVGLDTVLQFDVTALVQAQLLAGERYLGFRFQDTVDTTLQFTGLPTLNIVGTRATAPAPATLAILAIGIAGLGLRRRL